MFAYRRTALRKRVVLNLRSGEALRGVLIAQRGPLLVLAGAELLEAGRPPVVLDGEAFVERANVAFAQALPAVTVDTPKG